MKYCRQCGTGFRNIESLNKHIEDCSNHEAVRIAMPGSGSKTKI